MKRHLNTLFVTTQGAYLAKDGEAVSVRVEKQEHMRVPLHHLGGIVCFGRVGASPALMGACGERGVAMSMLSEHGRFLARITGYTSGNVLLRREQYRRADHEGQSVAVARNIVAAKIANSRSVIARATRDYPHLPHIASLESAATYLGKLISGARAATSLRVVRGIEGDAARTYFGVFRHLITAPAEGLEFTGRNRRPPLDPVNALLSFLYAMLGHDVRAACESAGLDPAVGFLHQDRPGRPGLALDLMEAFRPFLADRLALSLINRRQVKPAEFHAAESGAVRMYDETRKTVLTAYQKRKQEEITHPFLKEKTTVGLMPQLQARLLARHLRDELDAYPAFVWK